MRSDRVFDALQTLRNRYMLCQLASKATRKFHRPSTRIQETMNGVLDRIADSERQASFVGTRERCRGTTAGCLTQPRPPAWRCIRIFPESPPFRKISR